jgi:hypothetical protein
MVVPTLVVRPGHPNFLDLPWEVAVDEWSSDRLVEMPTGIHRHPVVFVAYDEGVYVIKELPKAVSEREYEVLGTLETRTHRSAVPVALVNRGWLEADSEQSGAVITGYVKHTFPYRRLVSGLGFGPRRNKLLDSVAGLLVELHLAGCFWGDCSLSNLLYRYDAGAIEAVMIDAETSTIRNELSDGQRNEDLEIMKENLAGEMADIAALNGFDLDSADLDIGTDIEKRYLDLWEELRKDLIITRDEGYRIRERIARLNDLGFSVHDVELEASGNTNLVRMTAHVGSRTFNSDRLRELTGLLASENQAKILLGDLSYFLAKSGGVTSTEKSVGVFKWLTTAFEPTIGRIADVWSGDDPVQGYCDFLNHRMKLASKRKKDVPDSEAFDSWLAHGFPGFD